MMGLIFALNCLAYVLFVTAILFTTLTNPQPFPDFGPSILYILIYTPPLLSGAADEVSVQLCWHLSLLFVMKSVENSSSSHGSLSLLFVMKVIMIGRHIDNIVFL
jgi:hypothetical protein